MNEPKKMSPEKRLHWGLQLVLVAAVLAVFWPALRGGFVHWDDGLNILDNPYLGLSWKSLTWMFTDTDYAPRYLPLGWLCYAVMKACFGVSAFSFHLTNLFLHSVNTLLLFSILVQLLRRSATDSSEKGTQSIGWLSCSPLGQNPATLSWAAAAGALWWALNPLRAEPVSWSSSIIFLVAANLFFLSILAYLRQGGSPGVPQPRCGGIGPAAIFFCLSLLTYPIALGGVAVFILLDFFPLQRLPVRPREWFSPLYRKIWREKVVFLLPTALVLFANVWARLGHLEKGALDGSSNFSISARLMQALWTCAWYVWKQLLPFDLTPLYPDLLTDLPFTFAHLAAAAVVTSISLLLFLRRKVWPRLFGIWLCYLSLVAPFTGVGDHPHFTCDRYAYILGALWAVLIAGGILVLLGRDRLRIPLILAVLLLCGLFGLQTQQQTEIWKNSLTLHTRMADGIGNRPQRAEHDSVRGIFLLRAGLPQEATVALRQALAFDPERSEAWAAFGDALADQNRVEPAMASYERALRLNPELYPARQNLAVALALAGRHEEAVTHFRTMLARNPEKAILHHNLALSLRKLGRLEEAQAHMAEVRRLQALAKAKP